MVSAKFHFREIDWVLYIPINENKKKKQREYSVMYRNRRSGETQIRRRVRLEEVMKKNEIYSKYPHSIGVYLDSSSRGKTWKPEYLITKQISDEKEFVGLLKALRL